MRNTMLHHPCGVMLWGLPGSAAPPQFFKKAPPAMAIEQPDGFLVTVATALATIIVGIAAAIPKIRGSMRRDKLESVFAHTQQDLLNSIQETFSSQIKQLDETNAKQAAQIEAMHTLIDKYRILLTQTKNVLVDVLAIVERSRIDIPEETCGKIREILTETAKHE